MQLSIGKIVKSNTHIDYICQIHGPGEALALPAPTSYAFGSFVAIEPEHDGDAVSALIGVIYNTMLLNPDFGNTGPRLSTRQELEIFSPDYLAETATLVGILALGWADAGGSYHQGVPALAATVNSPVRRLGDDEVREFHADAHGQPLMRYASMLLSQRDPIISSLLITILDSLNRLFPHSQKRLTVMRNNIAWKSIVQPAG